MTPDRLMATTEAVTLHPSSSLEDALSLLLSWGGVAPASKYQPFVDGLRKKEEAKKDPWKVRWQETFSSNGKKSRRVSVLIYSADKCGDEDAPLLEIIFRRKQVELLLPDKKITIGRKAEDFRVDEYGVIFGWKDRYSSQRYSDYCRIYYEDGKMVLNSLEGRKNSIMPRKPQAYI